MKFQKKYDVNENFFETWSSDMAYVLGFWWADGCITGDMFSISQKTKDNYILKDILKSMGSNYPIYIYNNQSALYIRCKKIVHSIKKIGGTERKSKVCVFPDVPTEFLPDFLRGLWDGDGSIVKRTNRKSYVASITSGSVLFIRQLQDVLKSNIAGFVGNKFYKCIGKKGKKMPGGKRLKKDIEFYQLPIGVNDTKRMGRFLYYDNCNLKLKRKADIFSSLSEIKEATYNKKFMDYESAKSFVSKLGLKNWEEWKRFSSSGKRPPSIPSLPNRTYKKKFVGMSDFLGIK